MSQRLTVKDIRNSRAPAVLNVPPDDSRIPQWLNGFQERALNRGRWWGTTQLARFCISNGCLTLPREVAVIEQATLNGERLHMGNLWYQMIRPHVNHSSAGNIVGLPLNSCQSNRCGCGCGCSQMTMEERSTAASFATTTGTNQKIRVYSNTADNGKHIIVQGYDKNGIWVRTVIDGLPSDGERLTLTAPFVDSVTIWGSGAPNAVIKDETNYRVLVYSVDATSGAELAIAEYQPTELNPMYRVMKIPGFSQGSCGSGCSTSSLMAVVSLQHIPVKYDTDWLLFTNLMAYQYGMLAEKYFEEGNVAMGNVYLFGAAMPARNARGVLRVTASDGAIPMLESELRKMTGDRTSVNMDYAGVNLIGFV